MAPWEPDVLQIYSEFPCCNYLKLYQLYSNHSVGLVETLLHKVDMKMKCFQHKIQNYIAFYCRFKFGTMGKPFTFFKQIAQNCA